MGSSPTHGSIFGTVSDTKEKMRKSKEGMYDGKKNPAYGKHWITNGIENKLVKKEDIPNGWRKGRV